MTRRTTRTHCPYCSLQCGIVLTAGDRPAELVPDEDFPTSRGGLCSKGWTAAEVPGDRTSALRRATWDEALDVVTDGIRAAQREHGRHAVGCFGGGGMTNEKAYALGEFARVALRTRHVDYNGRFCMSSAAAALNASLGVDRGMPFPMSDIAEADAVMGVGGNPASTMPPVMQYFDAGRARGAVHVVVDVRRTPTAAGAALHLQPVPGTDAVLALGMLHLAVRDGLVDTGYVAARTNGWDAARRALALGLPGRPGSGFGTLTGQGNGQGGREHGLKADQLPGYRLLTDPAARAHVAAVWEVDPDDLPGPGVSAFEMIDALGSDGGVRALLVLASNIVVSAPDADRVRRRLGALDLLVVGDFFLSKTAALADVVLPVSQWAEEEGTMTNFEGRVLHRRRALDPPDGVLTDLELVHALAGRLGQPKGFPTDAREVFEEERGSATDAREAVSPAVAPP